MDCDRADLVIGLLEGELDPAEKAEVEAHLQGCGACRETRDAYAATLSDLRALPAERPSPEAAARAYAAVVEAMSAAPVGAPVAPAQAAGKVLAFPAPRARGRGGLVVQLAAAAACLLLVVALATPQREARTAASAPAAPAADAVESGPASPAPTSAKAQLEPAAKPKDESLAAVEETSAEHEADDVQAGAALALRRRAEETEKARLARELARDAAAGEGPAADEPARPSQGGRPAPTTSPPPAPTTQPQAAPTTQPPSVPPRAPQGDDGSRGGSTEPLGEPDADLGGVTAERSRGAPPAPPPAPGAAGGAPARRQAGTANALGAWRATLDGEPFDVALLPGAADGPPLVVVARRTAAAPAGEDRRSADAGDEVQLLDGAAASPDLLRSLEAPQAERADAKLDLDAKARPSANGANGAGVDTRRLLLALLAHEVASSPTASRSEAAEVARVERVAALLAALDGRPLNGPLTGDRGRALLRRARERVERDLPASRSSR